MKNKAKKILLWIALIISAMGFINYFIDAFMYVFRITDTNPLMILFGVAFFGFLTIKIQEKIKGKKKEIIKRIKTEKEKQKEKQIRIIGLIIAIFFIIAFALIVVNVLK